MSSLLNVLLGSMTSDSSVSSLSQKTGLSSKVVSAIVAAAIPMLLKSLTSNASSANGLSSLMGALTQHTSTKSLDAQIADADVEDGQKIIGHIFGEETTDAVTRIAQETGAETDQISAVLGNMAPALMSTLSAATTAGKQDASAGLADLDLGGLTDLVGGLFGGASDSSASAASGLSGLVGGLLGGGSASSGGGLGSLLGGLLGGGAAESSSSADDGTDLLSSLLGFKL